jgi:hypothetical protein
MIITLAAAVGPETVRRLVEVDDIDVATSLLRDALLSSERFQRAVQPLRLGTAEVVLIDARTPLLESRFLTVAAEGNPLRADVEVICFLADPESYTGGELLIDTGYGDVARKEASGSCVVCPTASNRRLTPVTAGENRIVRIQVQSRVRDAQKRIILYDLSTAADFLDLVGITQAALVLRRCCDRLIGLWAEV